MKNTLEKMKAFALEYKIELALVVVPAVIIAGMILGVC